MNALVRGLTWPVVGLVAIGATHLIGEMLRPQLQSVIGAAVVMPIYLAVGAWAGYGTLRAGGGIGQGIAAGAVLGLLPVGLQVVGFGMILGRDTDAVVTSAAFGFLGLLWGAILGSGVARSLVESPASQPSEARNRNTGAAVA